DIQRQLGAVMGRRIGVPNGLVVCRREFLPVAVPLVSVACPVLIHAAIIWCPSLATRALPYAPQAVVAGFVVTRSDKGPTARDRPGRLLNRALRDVDHRLVDPDHFTAALAPWRVAGLARSRLHHSPCLR